MFEEYVGVPSASLKMSYPPVLRGVYPYYSFITPPPLEFSPVFDFKCAAGEIFTLFLLNFYTFSPSFSEKF